MFSGHLSHDRKLPILNRFQAILWRNRATSTTFFTVHRYRQKEQLNGKKRTQKDGPSFTETVGVESAGQNIVDPEPGGHDGEEGGGGAGHKALVGNPVGVASVEDGGVDAQGDQGAGLLGVPPPKASPGVVGPDPSQNNSRRQQNDPIFEAGVGYLGIVMLLLGGQFRKAPFEQNRIGQNPREGKGAVGEDDYGDVGGEPEIVPQNRNEGD